MQKSHAVAHVGAPDPELRTSPIFDEREDEMPSLDMEIETAGCLYNNVRYPIGQYVAVDGEFLHCEERGIWVRKHLPEH